MKEQGVQRDFANVEMRNQAFRKTVAEKPFLLVGAHPCTTWRSQSTASWSRTTQREKFDELHRVRNHFGSRAISVQVNIVAVSDHVFHRFPFDLLIQVSATKLSLFLRISVVLTATDRACEDAMHTSFPGSPPPSSNVGSPHGSGHDLDEMGTRSGSTVDEKLDALLSKICTLRNADRANCSSFDLDVPCGFIENTWGFRVSTLRDETEF